MATVMFDIAGYELTAQDKEIAAHPAIGGVILFSRNYDNIAQLQSLIQQLRQLRRQPLLIAVDHEGGRVQRFRQGFTAIAPAQAFASLKPLPIAQQLATEAGWLIAQELTALDIDISFTPVLDLGHQCQAIGSRAFSADMATALAVAQAMIDGIHQGGMKVTGKHFPGHGGVIADSHKETPIDNRARADILADMQIFAQLIARHQLDAIMPAHVIYPAFDDQPASGSRYWLKEQLRATLGFNGIIFSDDLSMEGAAMLGSYAERARASMQAGCDVLLVCNNRAGVEQILQQCQFDPDPAITRLRHHNAINYSELLQSSLWQQRHQHIEQLNDEWQRFINQSHV